MADPESQPSIAEQRAFAVAKLKRAASLPRMKDGRRPPMHSESVSEGEKAASGTPTPPSTGPGKTTPEPLPDATSELQSGAIHHDHAESPERPQEGDDDGQQNGDNHELMSTEADGDPEDRSFSPNPSRSRRRRSRSRSRNSKDFKGKSRGAPSPLGHIAGDSSPDEAPPMPIALPIVITPIASPYHRFLPSPDPSMFYPLRPTTPAANPNMPTLDEICLMRSNSVGGAAASRRMAMAKLTGGTDVYEPSPSSTPPPSALLVRNNTVAGGERIAARKLMLGRLANRVAKEADAEQQASGEDRGAPSPTPSKRRRRRSRRNSSAANAAISDSEHVSTNSNTPLPPLTHPAVSPDHLQFLRAQSATPNQASNSRNQSSEMLDNFAYNDFQNDLETEHHELHRRRSVVVEDDEEEERYPPIRSRTPAITPPPHRGSPHIPNFRGLHANDSPASHSTDSVPGVNGNSVPLFLGRGSPARFDRFPSSPFMTPLKERQPLSDDDEQVLYPADTLRPRTPASATVPISDSRPRTPYGTDRDAFDRQISWVASPVPEINLPIDDDDAEDDEDDEELGAEVPVQDDRGQYQDYDEPVSPVNDFSQSGVYDDASPRVSASSTSIVIESEASADIHHGRPPQFSPPLLSQSYSQQLAERSVLNGDVYPDWEDPLLSREASIKPSAEASSQSAWEKVKNTFSRSASSAGRRSRSNSIINRERNSSVSRESGASLTSGGKGERADSFTPPSHQHVAPPLMQSPSASASISSLSPGHNHMRGNPSPIPPVSDADRAKYQSDKLFPFPGMKKLEEQRRDRARGVFPMASASTPDVSQLTPGEEAATPLSATSFSSVPQTPDGMYRERKLSHQASDSRLNFKPGQDMPTASPVRQEYIDLMPLNASTSSGSSKHKLPMTFGDVKQWLSKNKGKKSSSSAISPPAAVTLSPSLDSQLSMDSNKMKATYEMFQAHSNEVNSDWEGKTPTTSKSTQGQTVNIHGQRTNGRETPATNGAPTDTERTPKAKKILPLTLSPSTDSRYHAFQDTPVDVSKPDRYMSPTPDPTSSISEFPALSTSESSSTSSQYSLGPTAQAIALLQRLDDALSRGPVPIDEMPRKLLFSSPVLQVVDPNTVKDRFLFLFTDILVIAKPILQEYGTLKHESALINPTDRKFIVKSVARFRDLRFCQDRMEPPPKSTPSMLPRSSLLRTFVTEFAQDPGRAVTGLLSKAKVPDASQIIGQILFKTQELDRKQLGEYLCSKHSKSILKVFLDNFGFSGLRIDIALRVFLQSIHIPQAQGVLEYLFDSFAGRWYEANAKILAYDRDMAILLARAIGQLDEVMHGDAEQQYVTRQQFCDAFRRYDSRRLVSDELLDDVYTSIREEPLPQTHQDEYETEPADIVLSFKRPPPTRLTYKIQSDPVIIRLPRADPNFTLHLYGQDLVFEPPVLTFIKSPEASFRVTGTSLGSKTLVFCRSGPDAMRYTGLPLTCTIPVERAFMRNTFQIAFLNHKQMKRRYMFSVDDHLLRHQWAQSIKQQIAKSVATPPPGAENPVPGASDFSRAADEVAFKVLQETLIGSHPNGLPQHGQNGHSVGYLSPSKEQSHNTPHRRSKSRSRLYPRQGAGKLEFDLSTSTNSHRFNSSHDSNDTTDADDNVKPHDPIGKGEGRSWSGRDIELQCQQNSCIPAVLSYLHSVHGAS